jgi:hypothetical protein
VIAVLVDPFVSQHRMNALVILRAQHVLALAVSHVPPDFNIAGIGHLASNQWAMSDLESRQSSTPSQCPLWANSGLM